MLTYGRFLTLGMSMANFSYDPGAGQRRLSWFLTVFFSLFFGLFGILSVIELPGAQGAPFLAVSAGIVVLFARQHLTGTLYFIELTETDLRWRSLIRGSMRPLSRVRCIRYSTMQTSRGVPQQTITVKFTDRRPLRFVAQEPGFAEFAVAVHAAAPHITVESPGR